MEVVEGSVVLVHSDVNNIFGLYCQLHLAPAVRMFVIVSICMCTQVIADIQELLTADNCNIMVVSKVFSGQCQEKEQWFGTLFSREGTVP